MRQDSSLVAGVRRAGGLENHPTVRNLFFISKEASCKPYVKINLANGCSDNFSTNISEQLHITNVNKEYLSTHKVTYIEQMVKYNNLYNSLDFIDETLSCLALHSQYNIDRANVSNLQSAADRLRNTLRAHHICLQHCQDEQFFCTVSQQVHHLRENYVCRACRNIKLTSLSDASVDFRIPKIGQLFSTQIEDDLGYDISGLVVRYE